MSASRSDTAQMLSGRLTGKGHVLSVRVYHEDTDHTGSVYHAGYLRFMERGRSDYVRLLGVDQRALGEASGGEAGLFVVSGIDIRYLRPARYDDVLDVESGVERVTGARVVLRQLIRRGAEVLTDAAVTIVLVNRDGRPRRLPEAVRRRFAAALG